jgi:alpha-1,2-mannosyltransferase
VYYAASDALLHGRLPYRDFILLHPPGLMLALTPFAVFGRLTTDHIGFEAANLAFAVLGAVNAGLVVLVARRMGLRRSAALVGGGFYAVWFGVVTAEYSARLEPLGNFAALVGLLALFTARGGRRRWAVLAGVAFGFAACVKIWWVVPLAVVLAGQFFSAAGRRRSAVVLGGAIATLLVVDGPFFAAAPSAMWRMVVADQLNRPRVARSAVMRVALMTTLNPGARSVTGTRLLVALAVCAVLALVIAGCAWRAAPARPVVLMLIAQCAVLVASPSYYSYYSAYLAPALALTVAAAAHGPRARRAWRVGPVAATLAATGCAAATISGITQHADNVIPPFPSARLARGMAHVDCLMSDSPMALIELDDLSRTLADGCPDRIDVMGRIYDADAMHTGPRVSRIHNPKWQRDMRRYLLSDDAVLIISPITGLDAATWRAIRHHSVLERAGPYVVYRVPPPTTHRRRAVPDTDGRA